MAQQIATNKILRNILNAGNVMEMKRGEYINRYKTNKGRRKLVNIYMKDLSSLNGVVGRLNNAKQRGVIREKIKSGDFQGMRSYVRDQLYKISEQGKNTAGGGEVAGEMARKKLYGPY